MSRSNQRKGSQSSGSGSESGSEESEVNSSRSSSPLRSPSSSRPLFSGSRSPSPGAYPGYGGDFDDEEEEQYIPIQIMDFAEIENNAGNEKSKSLHLFLSMGERSFNVSVSPEYLEQVAEEYHTKIDPNTMQGPQETYLEWVGMEVKYQKEQKISDESNQWKISEELEEYTKNKTINKVSARYDLSRSEENNMNFTNYLSNAFVRGFEESLKEEKRAEENFENNMSESESEGDEHEAKDDSPWIATTEVVVLDEDIVASSQDITSKIFPLPENEAADAKYEASQASSPLPSQLKFDCGYKDPVFSPYQMFGDDRNIKKAVTILERVQKTAEPIPHDDLFFAPATPKKNVVNITFIVPKDGSTPNDFCNVWWVQVDGTGKADSPDELKRCLKMKVKYDVNAPHKIIIDPTPYVRDEHGFHQVGIDADVLNKDEQALVNLMQINAVTKKVDMEKLRERITEQSPEAQAEAQAKQRQEAEKEKEALRLKQQEDEAKKKLAEDDKKKEDEAKRKLAEDEAKRKLAEDEAKRKLAEDEAKRKLAEDEAKRKLEEDAKKKLEEDKKKEEDAKKKKEEDAKKKLEEDAKKKLEEDEAKKKKVEDADYYSEEEEEEVKVKATKPKSPPVKPNHQPPKRKVAQQKYDKILDYVELMFQDKALGEAGNVVGKEDSQKSAILHQTTGEAKNAQWFFDSTELIGLRGRLAQALLKGDISESENIERLMSQAADTCIAKLMNDLAEADTETLDVGIGRFKEGIQGKLTAVSPAISKSQYNNLLKPIIINAQKTGNRVFADNFEADQVKVNPGNNVSSSSNELDGALNRLKKTPVPKSDWAMSESDTIDSMKGIELEKGSNPPPKIHMLRKRNDDDSKSNYTEVPEGATTFQSVIEGKNNSPLQRTAPEEEQRRKARFERNEQRSSKIGSSSDKSSVSDSSPKLDPSKPLLPKRAPPPRPSADPRAKPPAVVLKKVPSKGAAKNEHKVDIGHREL